MTSPGRSGETEPSDHIAPSARHGRGGHGHLWQLPDGTGLHAPYGVLVRSDDETALCCHLCGRWFSHLGGHVRAHGVTASGYREMLGLLKGVPLVVAQVSASIAARQQAAYRADALVRERLADGQEMARSGQLAWRARRTQVSPQLAAERLTRLAAGRATSAARRAEELSRRLARLGAHDLHGYLRAAYLAGASLEDLGRRTRLGRERLRSEMTAAGITVRPPGAAPTSRRDVAST